MGNPGRAKLKWRTKRISVWNFEGEILVINFESIHYANLKPEDSKFFSLENIRNENEKKNSALRRFGRDLTELAAKGCLPPLIGRRSEMLKITQILRQSRKNNLILVGEPGVGKTGIFR